MGPIGRHSGLHFATSAFPFWSRMSAVTSPRSSCDQRVPQNYPRRARRRPWHPTSYALRPFFDSEPDGVFTGEGLEPRQCTSRNITSKRMPATTSPYQGKVCLFLSFCCAYKRLGKRRNRSNGHKGIRYLTTSCMVAICIPLARKSSPDTCDTSFLKGRRVLQYSP